MTACPGRTTELKPNQVLAPDGRPCDHEAVAGQRRPIGGLLCLRETNGIW